MSETKFYDLTGIEVFDVGVWNGRPYTDEDLDEMVANFATLSAAGYDFPCGISHDPDQQLVANSELPAAGYIQRLYRSGTKLAADLTRIPDKVKQLIELKAYKTVSAEIYDRVQLLGQMYSNVVSSVRFLGAEIPAVGTIKNLDDALALYHRARPLVFSELAAGATRSVITYDPKEARMTDTAKDTVDDEVTELDKELTTLAERAANATKGKTGAPAFRAFLRETIAKLRGLASKKRDAAAADMSFEERRELVAAAVRAKWGGLDGYGPYITEMYDADVIISRDASYWRVPYSIDDNDNVALGDAVEVEQTWTPKTSATQNTAGSPGKEEDMAITKMLATALGLPETADEPAVLKAIGDMKAENTQLRTDHAATAERVTKLEHAISEGRAEKAADDAIAAHKLLPAKREWAKTFAAKDPLGFTEWVKDAPEVLDVGERGSGNDAPEAQSDVAQFQAKLVEKVKAGTSLEQAQREVAAEEPGLFAAIRARR